MSSKQRGLFPLRAGFFRSPPMNEEDRGDYLKQSEELATNFVRLADHQRWRSLPPEKDGVQVCKDTSNLEKSMRLMRTAITLPCTLAEVKQLFSQTTSDGLRSIGRRFFMNDFLDGVVLHTIEAQDASRKPPKEQESLAVKAMTNPKIAVGLFDDAVKFIKSNSTLSKLKLTDAERLAAYALYQLATVGPCSTPKPDSPALQAKWEAWSKLSKNHTKDQAKAAYVQFLTGKVPEWYEAAAPPEPPAPKNRTVTLKWAAFQAGLGQANRDICVLDCLDITKDEHDNEIGIWCCKSIEGHKVGCMELTESHSLTRASVARVGFLWRSTGEQGEMEIIFCGSVPSKYVKNISQSVISAMGRLQSMIEDLRISRQQFVMRNQWIDDKDRPGCNLCMKNFHSFRRKHHCRMCGEVVCSDCSILRQIELPVVGASKIRLCKACLSAAKKQPLNESMLEDMPYLDRAVLTTGMGYSGSEGSDKESRRFPFAKRGTDLESYQSSDYEQPESYPESHSTYNPETSNSSSSAQYKAAYTPSGSAQNLHFSGAMSGSNNNIKQRSASPIPDRESRTSSMRHKSKPVHMPRDASKKKTSFSEMVLNSGGSPESIFDLLCDLACQALDCPVACVTLYDNGQQLYRSSNGITSESMDIELQLCTDTVLHNKPVVVLDVLKNSALEKVSGKMQYTRFFAGTPICDSRGRKVGTVCVADRTPRDKLGKDDIFMMEKLATLALRALEERQIILRDPTGSPQEEGYGMMSTASSAQSSVCSDTYFRPPVSTEEKMKSLLMKSYETQQQMASSHPVYSGRYY